MAFSAKSTVKNRLTKSVLGMLESKGTVAMLAPDYRFNPESPAGLPILLNWQE